MSATVLGTTDTAMSKTLPAFWSEDRQMTGNEKCYQEKVRRCNGLKSEERVFNLGLLIRPCRSRALNDMRVNNKAVAFRAENSWLWKWKVQLSKSRRVPGMSVEKPWCRWPRVDTENDRELGWGGHVETLSEGSCRLKTSHFILRMIKKSLKGSGEWRGTIWLCGEKTVRS